MSSSPAVLLSSTTTHVGVTPPTFSQQRRSDSKRFSRPATTSTSPESVPPTDSSTYRHAGAATSNGNLTPTTPTNIAPPVTPLLETGLKHNFAVRAWQRGTTLQLISSASTISGNTSKSSPRLLARCGSVITAEGAEVMVAAKVYGKSARRLWWHDRDDGGATRRSVGRGDGGTRQRTTRAMDGEAAEGKWLIRLTSHKGQILRIISSEVPSLDHLEGYVWAIDYADDVAAVIVYDQPAFSGRSTHLSLHGVSGRTCVLPWAIRHTAVSPGESDHVVFAMH